MISQDITLRDGRILRVHDTGPPSVDRGSAERGSAERGSADRGSRDRPSVDRGSADRPSADPRDARRSTGPATGLTLVWHHGSPQTGALLEPVVMAAAARGIRVVSYGRPSYGGSTPRPGRDVASAADDVAQLADALGLGTLVTMGASGGGPHALACAALLRDRVTGVVCLAGLAPLGRAAPADERQAWFAGMAAPGGLLAAARGRAARATFAETDEFDLECFTAADWATLDGAWAALGDDAQRAGAAGPDGLIDDDVAFMSAWGFDLNQVRAPVLLVQGTEDRVVPPFHAHLLARGLVRAQTWLRPGDGHISVLTACGAAMDWLLDTDHAAVAPGAAAR